MLFHNKSLRQRHTETCLLNKRVIKYSPSNTAAGEACIGTRSLKRSRQFFNVSVRTYVAL